MQTKAQQLAALDADFDSAENRATGRMKAEAYWAQRKAIEALPDPVPEPAPKAVPAAEGDRKPITMRFFKKVMDMVTDAVAERIAAQDRRISALEAGSTAPSVKYRGVWNEDEQYNEANVATHGGTIWFCKRSTCARPGSCDDWQLMVKSK